MSYFRGDNPVPYEIEIQPSAKCNANCTHCWAKKFKRLEDKLNLKENADKVIGNVLGFDDEAFSTPKIKFCGSTGDPLMNPLTTYFIERFYGKREMRLFTNGIKIGQEKFDRNYLDSLSKLDMLYLSLDAGKSETLWKVKRGAKTRNISVEDILDGSRRIKEISPRTKINVSYVITEENYEDILLATDKVKMYGLDLIRFRIDITGHRMSKRVLDSIWENLKVARNFQEGDFKVIPIHSESEVKGKNEINFGTKNSGIQCFTNLFWTCVGPDGNVYPCGHIVNPETKNYGSLLEKSFEEIWNGEKRKNARKCLPGKLCKICSPFSLRTNKFMGYLDSLTKEKSKELLESVF